MFLNKHKKFSQEENGKKKMENVEKPILWTKEWKLQRKRKTLKVLKMHSGKFNKYKMITKTQIITLQERKRITYLSTAKYLKRKWLTPPTHYPPRRRNKTASQMKKC